MRARTLMIGAGISLALHGPLAAQAEYGLKAGPSFGNIKNQGLFPGDLKTRIGAAGATGVAGGLAVAAAPPCPLDGATGLATVPPEAGAGEAVGPPVGGV